MEAVGYPVMAKELLSDKAIRAAIKAAQSQPRDSKATALQDGGGLSLLVQPETGAAWWRLRYWISSKENRLSLGTYPTITLAAARQRVAAARKLIADGVDPSDQRKADKERTRAQNIAREIEAAGGPPVGSFEAVAREWLRMKHEPDVSAGHAERTRLRLEQMAFPFIGRDPIDKIYAPTLLRMLRKIEARGAIETAHRVKDACGQVFRYGIAAGYCDRNPAADLRDALRPVPARHHAAIIDPQQGAQLLRDLIGYAGHPVTCAALRLSAMLMLRPGELRQLEWTWVDFDAAAITVPSETMKRTKADKTNGAPHVVPLAPQAVEVLRELQPLTRHSRYVFPSLLTRERCMSENTVRGALRRMGYSNDEMTAHGFRAMARTMIAERLGVPPEVIEAQLAHAVSDALGRAYNRAQFLDQRRDMMAKWADYLDKLAATPSLSRQV
jgi:integrase